MKKVVLTGLLALGVLAISHQQASAWVNSRFGIGLNWDRQSGGNNFLWGAYRNGQPPGPEAFGDGFNAGGFPASPFSGPMPTPFGGAPMPQGFAPPAPMPSSIEPPYAGQFATPFQFATYPRPGR